MPLPQLPKSFYLDKIRSQTDSTKSCFAYKGTVFYQKIETYWVVVMGEYSLAYQRPCHFLLS